MRVAGLMSGSGTNLVKVIERSLEGKGADYEVVVIVTDTPESRAEEISDKYGIPMVCSDIKAFYRSKGHETRKDISLRPEYDAKIVEELKPFNVDLIVLAGYMSIITEPLLDEFDARLINVHPADLSIVKEGRRIFTGAHAVRDSILYGCRELRSSTHIVRREVDCGEILLISDPVPVHLPECTSLEALKKKENRKLLNTIANEHQEKLKCEGDWVVLPKTLEWISRGRFGIAEDGNVTLDGKPVPDGVRLDAI
jgi:folate-dependent phosphoribosylglycinamide formyltransferase PurN